MSDRMRICFLSLMFSPIVGGSEKQAEKQARQLQGEVSAGSETAIGRSLEIRPRNVEHWRPVRPAEKLSARSQQREAANPLFCHPAH